MQISNSTLSDIPQIFEFYRLASNYMKSKKQVSWPEFPKEMIINEVNENRQWKLLIDNQIACIWATTLKDELIWGDDKAPSIYIHRIATNPNFRGQNLVKNVVDWANEYGKNMNLNYLRLDTVGINRGLINHYQKLGFNFLGSKPLQNTEGLPEHYKEGEICYFQKEII